MKTLRFLLLFFILLAAPATALAAKDEPPDVLAKRTTEEVLTIIRQDSEIKHNRKKLFALIDAKVLPHFDFTHMTRLAVGRHWSGATPQQQQDLVREFRTLLVRTYSTALTNYKNQKVVFKPLHMQPGETDVTIKTESIQSGEKPIPIDYMMEKSPAGWKVYDIAVDNVSLITNYRSSFSSEINKNGVEGLIKVLKNKNQTSEAEK
ncbi:ABC transporter substrate-binding protein [Sulfuricella sp.]|uniref:MlaC/ttg2D family ABC transporter substrate-binding protein n=1 Tax=Sulfuricella sp. TaxID=2099377 RepID=UPI002BFBB05E|nr:ABC transporter substrate-binding protein [Sulfuricella sp.]HUX63358.1 ABC transporter substrate-binding protein [Sulfuricella sp.]